ncbi:MAG TPA: motility protein A [bacterium]|nr:motility protein A [bacterium]
MDIATVLGLFLGVVGIMGGAFIEGIPFQHLWGLSAFLIVAVGSAGATMMSFPAESMKEFIPVLRKAFKRQELDPGAIVTQLVGFAAKARREGLLGLEEEAETVGDPFLKKGLQLVVDGTDIEMIRNIMETDIAFLEARHKVGESIFGTFGGFSPTLGIIGTVLGLVHALGNLGEGAANNTDAILQIIGAIATAFIATFYGISLANIFFLPISFKLKQNNSAEVLLREVMLEGILAISAGDNPRIVEEKLKAFLPPKLKLNMEAQKEAAAGKEPA